MPTLTKKKQKKKQNRNGITAPILPVSTHNNKTEKATFQKTESKQREATGV